MIDDDAYKRCEEDFKKIVDEEIFKVQYNLIKDILQKEELKNETNTNDF